MTMGADSRNVPEEVSFIITIIINIISCPFTVLLNVLVIMAVKRRPRLQTNTNILLACLAATDVLTGCIVQPSFIVWKSICLLDLPIDSTEIKYFNSFALRALSVCSSLQLVLVTCERLIAIKFTVDYPYLVTKRNIKVAEIVVWAFLFISELVRYLSNSVFIRRAHNLIVSLELTFCILFIVSVYVILYRETRRHKKKIKTQQLPQEEMERFFKESKALKTTVLVVSAVVICFLPIAVTVSLKRMMTGKEYDAVWPLVRTFGMLNSLLNPLIYCLRQKEMRRFVLRVPCQAVEPALNWTERWQRFRKLLTV